MHFKPPIFYLISEYQNSENIAIGNTSPQIDRSREVYTEGTPYFFLNLDIRIYLELACLPQAGNLVVGIFRQWFKTT